MTNTVDNVLTKQENAITAQKLRSAALNGKYYSYEMRKWKNMGWLEKLARKLFVCFLDSVEKTCMHRSWKAIEKMPNLPESIQTHIEDIFLDSLYHTNPLSSHSGAISRVFCKTVKEKANERGFVINQIDVQQHPTERSFGVFYNKKLLYIVANSRYGKLDFYNPKRIKVAINDHDSLWNIAGKRIGAIRLAVDYSKLDSCMELYSGKDLLHSKVIENTEKVTLVFCEAMTNRIIAVSNLSKKEPLIYWNITLIDQDTLDRNKITPMLLAWTILKYSQHYHFPSPYDLKYIKDLPNLQVFRT